MSSPTSDPGSPNRVWVVRLPPKKAPDPEPDPEPMPTPVTPPDVAVMMKLGLLTICCWRRWPSEAWQRTPDEKAPAAKLMTTTKVKAMNQKKSCLTKKHLATSTTDWH